MRTAALIALLFASSAGSAFGAAGFTSNDPLLNTIWRESAKTAALVRTVPVRLGPGCSFPAGHTIILDGVVRDRCEFIGDLTVTAPTLLVTQRHAGPDIRFALEQFAKLQRPDGSLPPRTSTRDTATTLADYQADWVETLADYVLYTGDRSTARRLYVCLTNILDRWYPANMDRGLFVNPNPRSDYAYIDRHSSRVAYYNEREARRLGRPSRGCAGVAQARFGAEREDRRDVLGSNRRRVQGHP
jgi:hypothetical protein